MNLIVHARLEQWLADIEFKENSDHKLPYLAHCT